MLFKLSSLLASLDQIQRGMQKALRTSLSAQGAWTTRV